LFEFSNRLKCAVGFKVVPKKDVERTYMPFKDF